MITRGFTLIELMLAVALSTLVVYTSVAAFRVSAQTITASKRMSLENSLLRTGFQAALNELDFWDQYDDRFASNRTTNPLRAVGKPFAPLTYDPTKHESDPKTWWRGLGFAVDTDATPAVAATNTSKWGNYGQLQRAGHTDPIRAWYPDQIRTINRQLGGYGMVSYLPGDAIYCWYENTASPFAMRGQPRDVWERTASTPVTVNGAAYKDGAFADLLPQKPLHWPGLRVETRRYVVWSSYIDLCQIEVRSPLSGESLRLSFWGVGSSLRGARQQRSLDQLDRVEIR